MGGSVSVLSGCLLQFKGQTEVFTGSKFTPGYGRVLVQFSGHQTGWIQFLPLYGLVSDRPHPQPHPQPRHQPLPWLAPLDGATSTVLQLLGGVAVVGGAVRVIGQQGRRGGGVSADDQLQAVGRLGDERNHQAAVKVPGPNVVDLRGGRGRSARAREGKGQLPVTETL